MFQFVGSYWWLIFPLMGVMAGIGRAWERGAKQRHARRLEIIRAKNEYRAERRIARGRGPAPAAAPPAEPLTQTQELERLFAAHDGVTARWLEYELDVAKLIAYPAMSDGRQPLTAAFLRAKKLADGLRPPSATAKLTREQLVEYRGAVTDFEVAFDLAERDAKRLRDTSFTEAERRRLDTAKQLLSVAVDQAATPAERQLAYRRVREELDGLISLSDDAIGVLENRVALELTPWRGCRDAREAEDPRRVDPRASREPVRTASVARSLPHTGEGRTPEELGLQVATAERPRGGG